MRLTGGIEGIDDFTVLWRVTAWVGAFLTLGGTVITGQAVVAVSVCAGSLYALFGLFFYAQLATLILGEDHSRSRLLIVLAPLKLLLFLMLVWLLSRWGWVALVSGFIGVFSFIPGALVLGLGRKGDLV